jgi:hypothetical protein
MAAINRRPQLNVAAGFQMWQSVSRFKIVLVNLSVLARIHSIHQLKVS